MITEIEDYFTQGCGRCDRFATPDCSTRLWADGLTRLREICLDVSLEETVKWGHPCYMAAGRNIAIIGAFRTDFRLTFFYAALLKDAGKVLELQGPNSRVPDVIRFTSTAQVVALEPVILSYLKEAMGYAEAGVKPPRGTAERELPDELVEALNFDPELADAFSRLTPGRRNSYAVAISSAKKAETRIARIARYRDKILAGKGAME